MSGGTTFALDEHDHGNAKDPVSTKGLVVDPHDHGKSHDHGDTKDQAMPASPIKEVALPEGLSSAQSMAIDSTGRVWFTEKVEESWPCMTRRKKSLQPTLFLPRGGIWDFQILPWVPMGKSGLP